MSSNNRTRRHRERLLLVRRGLRKFAVRLSRLNDRLERAHLDRLRIQPIPSSFSIKPDNIHIAGHHAALYRIEGDFE